MISEKEAIFILKSNLPTGTKIISMVSYNDDFLFIAHRPDPLEGKFDPFFKVNKITGNFRDFSPQDYEDPLVILNLLTDNAK